MKHNRLCAIAHNVADSMASGMCFVIGVWSVDVFGEAFASKDGVIEVDFLHGQIVRGDASDSLRSAAARFAEILPEFCQKNGADVADFDALSAAFEVSPLGPRMSLTVSDRMGHCSVTEYAGVPLKRLRRLDNLGRIRRAARQVVAIPR
jgi:hypothetical protein